MLYLSLGRLLSSGGDVRSPFRGTSDSASESAYLPVESGSGGYHLHYSYEVYCEQGQIFSESVSTS